MQLVSLVNELHNNKQNMTYRKSRAHRDWYDNCIHAQSQLRTATLIIQRWKCRNVISHSFLTKLGQNSEDFFFCPKFIHKSFNFLICGVCDTVKQFCRKSFPPSIKIKISDRVYLNVSDCFNFLNEPSRPICLFSFV